MLWVLIGINGARLTVVSGRLKAVDNTELLESELLPFESELGGINWISQHDNAATHDASTTHK